MEGTNFHFPVQVCIFTLGSSTQNRVMTRHYPSLAIVYSMYNIMVGMYDHRSGGHSTALIKGRELD